MELLAKTRTAHADNPVPAHDRRRACASSPTWKQSAWPPIPGAALPHRRRHHHPGVPGERETGGLAFERPISREGGTLVPLWPHLSLGWVADLAQAIDSYADGDMESCIAHLERLENRADLDIEVGLLGTLARYRMGDLDGAVAAATGLCQRRPEYLRAKRSLAGCRSIRSMIGLARGQDVLEELTQVQELFSAISTTFDVAADLAEVELLIGMAHEHRGTRDASWFERSHEHFAEVLEGSPEHLAVLVNDAAALTSMSRLSKNRCRPWSRRSET